MKKQENYAVFASGENGLKLIGKSKNDFYNYFEELTNEGDIVCWRPYEIEESVNGGYIDRDELLVVELLDNGNDWVFVGSADGSDILFTQKSFDSADSLEVDLGDEVIYFKPTSELTEKEKNLSLIK